MSHNNPQTPRIILFRDKEIEVTHGKQYLVITDHEGVKHKISEKRQSLWAVFEDAKKDWGYLLFYETYNNIEYVADVKLLSEAIANAQALRAVSAIVLKLGDQQTEERNRSTALSYSKDLACANKIDIDNLYKTAYDNYIFIKGQWKPTRGED